MSEVSICLCCTVRPRKRSIQSHFPFASLRQMQVALRPGPRQDLGAAGSGWLSGGATGSGGGATGLGGGATGPGRESSGLGGGATGSGRGATGLGGGATGLGRESSGLGGGATGSGGGAPGSGRGTREAWRANPRLEFSKVILTMGAVAKGRLTSGRNCSSIDGGCQGEEYENTELVEHLDKIYGMDEGT